QHVLEKPESPAGNAQLAVLVVLLSNEHRRKAEAPALVVHDLRDRLLLVGERGRRLQDLIHRALVKAGVSVVAEVGWGNLEPVRVLEDEGLDQSRLRGDHVLHDVDAYVTRPSAEAAAVVGPQ